MRVTSRSAPFPYSRHQQPARAAAQIRHVRAPLVEDQIEAGAEAVPTLLERRRVAGTIALGISSCKIVSCNSRTRTSQMQAGYRAHQRETTPGSMRVTSRSAFLPW